MQLANSTYIILRSYSLILLRWKGKLHRREQQLHTYITYIYNCKFQVSSMHECGSNYTLLKVLTVAIYTLAYMARQISHVVPSDIWELQIDCSCSQPYRYVTAIYTCAFYVCNYMYVYKQYLHLYIIILTLNLVTFKCSNDY